MATVFSAPEIGSAQAVGIKNSGIREFTHDVINPVSRIERDQFTGSKQLEFRWRSDSSRFWSPRDSKLKVTYDVAFASTAGSFDKPNVSAHNSVRMSAIPNTVIFGGGQRYMQNSVLIENQTDPVTVGMANLLMKTDYAGSDTSGSNALLSLRKDMGADLTGKLFSLSTATQGIGYDMGAAPWKDVPVNANTTMDDIKALKVKEVFDSMTAVAPTTVTEGTGTNGKADNVNPKQLALTLGYDDGQTDGTGISTIQISEPLVALQSWSHGFAIGPSDHQLFVNVSPTWTYDVLHSGQPYTVVQGIPAPAAALAKTLYIQVRDIEFLAAFVGPAKAFVPRSISLKWSGMQVSTRLLQSKVVNEVIVCPPSTRMVICSLRQRVHTLNQDVEEIGLAGIGKSLVGGHPVYGWETWQAQIGSSMAPSPPYGALNTATGEMARPFADYLSACGKSLGLRGSTLSYAEYCGFQSVNGPCGTAKGEKGNVFIVRILTPPSSLSNTLNIRGTLRGAPTAAAQQEMVVICINDQLLNVEYSEGSSLPVSTSVAPII